MKHLKNINELNTFNESLAPINVIDDLKEILMDLDDIGFSNTIKSLDGSIIIFISKQDITKEFYFTDDVKMVIIRVYNYLTELGYYSNLMKDGGMKLYVKGDRIRTDTIHWVGDKWPSISYLKLKFNK